ncbi:MAG: heme exporter protein CcmB [Gemmatimonadetes bacterium]|nr:heme exporter protein CcmB [Gemmatimonadota bacterium]
MTWKDEWRRVWAIVWKDLTTERRSKAGLNAVAFMGILVLLLFGFALGPDTEALRNAAAGALWLAILFAGVLAFNRSYQLELDGGALESLLLYPGARWAIYAGKLIANLVFVLIVEAVVVPGRHGPVSGLAPAGMACPHRRDRSRDDRLRDARDVLLGDVQP